MSGRILFVHYTPPGVVGGVEHIMHQHARLLAERGYEVRIVAGRPSDADASIDVIPEIEAARPENALVEAELDAGVVSPRFWQMRSAVLDRLRPLATWADTIVAHNAFTLHFNLALTAVLWELAIRRPPATVLAWCHDLAWTNPLYIPLMHPGYPWNLLRLPAPNVRYITVSEERRDELRGLWGRDDPPIAVVPNGIDAVEFLRLSRDGREIVERYRLLERELVLLLPVRITRRKNVEAGIRAVRNLKDRGMDVCFLISGPQAPHHPGRSDAYLGSLLQMRRDLGVENEVVFLTRELGRTLDSRTVSELYSVADVLLLPSAQEGFGLPIIEAGLARVPAVLSDIQIFREVAGEDAWTFSPAADADTIAGAVVEALNSKPSRLYRSVLRRYRWDAIMDDKILPLLSHGKGATAETPAHTRESESAGSV
jgi:glycosyltransferase involved in cell wall biosynthesis